MHVTARALPAEATGLVLGALPESVRAAKLKASLMSDVVDLINSGKQPVTLFAGATEMSLLELIEYDVSDLPPPEKPALRYEYEVCGLTLQVISVSEVPSMRRLRCAFSEDPSEEPALVSSLPGIA